LIEGDAPCNHSYAYQSIIGTGRIVFLSAPAEKIDALNKLTQHVTGSKESHSFSEQALQQVTVYKMEVEEFTGKEEKR
ncbi:MAG: pyridoxamine 5'-phosphate oxidase family protein, partial [Clostridiales Family XIII bacterium]|jgi:nitroimidazol reductase NimA-like FMN-containing flavoprotein (pyridoxamine 5'-phosphate oxidase superfamily)|nr:pyridoxamine 5'-phosphate oxidase family protein [Clostridiales Family XIII bacterium]